MLDRVREKRDELYAIARRHKAEKIWVFGSVARKEETPASDVDFLVKFQDGATLFDMGNVNYYFENALGRSVDVVDYGALEREPFFSYAVKKDLLAI